jgi:hypothetical protein
MVKREFDKLEHLEYPITYTIYNVRIDYILKW